MTLGVYVLIKGIKDLLMDKESRDEEVDNSLYRKACKNLFGPWYLIAPWGGYILIVLALLIFGVLLPSTNLLIFLLLGGLVYDFWINRLVKKQIELME